MMCLLMERLRAENVLLIKETKENPLKEKKKERKKKTFQKWISVIGFLSLHVPSSGHSHRFYLQGPSATLSQWTESSAPGFLFP